MSKENNYDPTKDGAVVAMRIHGATSPKAELAFAFGGSTVVEWDIASERKKYEKGINSYTYIFDERTLEIGRTFQSFVKPKTEENR